MMMEHDMLLRNKNLFYNTIQQYNEIDWDEFKARVNDLYLTLYYKLWDHLQKENEEIFPKAFDLIKEDTKWHEMTVACDEIGYSLFMSVSQKDQ